MKYRESFLDGTSTMNESPSSLIDGHFDFALISSSWDKRCKCITDAKNFRASHGALLLFETRDELGLRENHDRILREFVERQISMPFIIEGESTDTSTMWQKVWSAIVKASNALQRPMRLFVDLSTCPRYLSIGSVTRCIQSGIASDVTVFYAEGDYPEETSEIDQHELFTTGKWDSLEIPGLQGTWDPEKKRAYLVSIGFEGTKTLWLVSRSEPDDVSILFPDPGVKPEYVERASQRNSSLLKRFRIPEERIIRAAAGDAVHAWKELSERHVDNPEQENVYYLCCGTKPHSLGLGLRAMAAHYPAVLYIVPHRHRVIDINPLGVYWRYDIRDLTALVANSDQ